MKINVFWRTSLVAILLVSAFGVLPMPSVHAESVSETPEIVVWADHASPVQIQKMENAAKQLHIWYAVLQPIRRQGNTAYIPASDRSFWIKRIDMIHFDYALCSRAAPGYDPVICPKG